MTNIFQGKRNKNIFTNIFKNICTQEYMVRRKGGSTAGSDSKKSVGILLILLQFSQ